MSGGMSCSCQFNCMMDTQGSKKDPIYSEKEWLDRAVRYLSREAVCKGKGQEAVWSSKCKPSWWDLTVQLPWKNPTSNPKDTKEELIKKYGALNKHLRDEGRFPRELEEESTLWAEGKFKELFSLTLLTSLRIRVMGIHTTALEVSAKANELKTEVSDRSNLIKDIQLCLEASIKVLEKSLSVNCKKRNPKRPRSAVDKENLECIKKCQLPSDADEDRQFVTEQSSPFSNHHETVAPVRKESATCITSQPTNTPKLNRKGQERRENSPSTAIKPDHGAAERNALQGTRQSKISISACSVSNPASAQFMSSSDGVDQINVSEKRQCQSPFIGFNNCDNETCWERSPEGSTSLSLEGNQFDSRSPGNCSKRYLDELSESSTSTETSLAEDELHREVLYERFQCFIQNTSVVEGDVVENDSLNRYLQRSPTSSFRPSAEFYNINVSAIQNIDDSVPRTYCDLTSRDVDLGNSLSFFDWSRNAEEPILDLDLHFSPEEQNKLFLEDDIEAFLPDLAGYFSAAVDRPIDIPSNDWHLAA